MILQLFMKKEEKSKRRLKQQIILLPPLIEEMDISFLQGEALEAVGVHLQVKEVVEVIKA